MICIRVEPPGNPEVMVPFSEVSFDSGGNRIAADLYRPAPRGRDVPCVVMAHGASGTKRLGLNAYASVFIARGIAVLAFDYRHFGESEGEPRQVIDVAEQRADFHAAVTFVREQVGIDPDRIALWGTSLSGGHVLAVAARDQHIAAVVTQVPMIDGWRRGRSLRDLLNWDVTVRTVQFVVAAFRDVERRRRGLTPYFVPVVAGPGRVAAFTEPEAKAAFDALGGEATGWKNSLAPRFLFSLPRYRKGTAERLHMPVLMVLADRDQETSSRFAARIGALIPNVEIQHYGVGHFDVYREPLQSEIATREAEFLQRHLSRRSQR